MLGGLGVEAHPSMPSIPEGSLRPLAACPLMPPGTTGIAPSPTPYQGQTTRGPHQRSRTGEPLPDLGAGAGRAPVGTACPGLVSLPHLLDLEAIRVLLHEKLRSQSPRAWESDQVGTCRCSQDMWLSWWERAFSQGDWLLGSQPWAHCLSCSWAGFWFLLRETG